MNLSFKLLTILLFCSAPCYGVQQDKLKKLIPTLHKNIRIISPVSSVLEKSSFYRISFEPRNFKSITIVESKNNLMKVPETNFSEFSVFMNNYIKEETFKLVEIEQASLFASSIYLLFDPVPHRFTCSKKALFFICGTPLLKFKIQIFKDGRLSLYRNR